MEHGTTPAARGRRTRSNDERILDAAKQVFGADPRASMAELGAAAGVGMSALYRRYSSKQALVETIVEEARVLYEREIDVAEDRLEAGDPALDVYADFLLAIVDSNVYYASPGAPPVAAALARGATEWRKITDANRHLFDAIQSAGVLRPGLDFIEVGMLLGAISAVRGSTPDRSRNLRRRALAVVLDGLRAGLAPLPGEPPDAADYRAP